MSDICLLERGERRLGSWWLVLFFLWSDRWEIWKEGEVKLYFFSIRHLMDEEDEDNLVPWFE